MITSTRLTLVALMILLAPAVRAQDPAQPPRTDLEAKIIKSLAQTIDIGAPLYNGAPPYNNPDRAGCFWLYRGALAAVMPLLDNRPDMQRSVQQKIDRAQSARSIEEKAFALREALDEIRATLHKDQPRAASTERSLWDRLGGQLAVKAVVHDFVAAAATDPKVNFMRGKPLPDAEGIAKLEDKVVEFISSATGGPLKYTGKDMVAAHTGMNITNEEFDALAGHLVATLKKFNVPEKETNELMTIVGSTRRDIVGR